MASLKKHVSLVVVIENIRNTSKIYGEKKHVKIINVCGVLEKKHIILVIFIEIIRNVFKIYNYRRYLQDIIMLMWGGPQRKCHT